MSVRDDLLAIPNELLRSGLIAQAVLVHMDFRDAPKRWWTGYGDLDAAGYRWQGLGDLISMSQISSTYQLSAEQMTFELAATPEMIALALSAETRVRNRPVAAYLQMFAMEDVQIDHFGPDAILSGQPVGPPISVYAGTMQVLEWGASGPNQRRLSLECEGRFMTRNQPPRGRWADADQKARYTNDKGFERMPLYANNYDPRWRG